MAAASLQQYKELGESMGLSGEKLSEFVREQQAADRADRQAEREREEKRAEREAQEKERERQAQKEEREHRELCATSEAVEKEKERQHQLELAKEQREAEEKQRVYDEKQQDIIREAEEREREEQREHELAKERIRVAAEDKQREHETAKLVQAKLAAEQATAKAKLEADSVAEQARNHPCLVARRLKKFHEDTPTSPEVIEPNAVNFRPNFKFSRFNFFFWGGGPSSPLGVCASKALVNF